MCKENSFFKYSFNVKNMATHFPMRANRLKKKKKNKTNRRRNLERHTNRIFKFVISSIKRMHSSDKWWFVHIIFISPSRSVCQARSTIRRKKKENTGVFYSLSDDFSCVQEGKEPLSLLIYLYLMHCFFLAHRIIMHYGRTDIYRCLFTCASKHFGNNATNRKLIRSWVAFNPLDSLGGYSGYQEVVLGSRDLGNSAEKRKRESIFLRTVIFPLSISLRAFCLVIADSVFHNNRDGKRANVPCRRFVKIEIAL